MTRKRLLNGSEKNNAPFTSVERQLVEMKKKRVLCFLEMPWRVITTLSRFTDET